MRRVALAALVLVLASGCQDDGGSDVGSGGEGPGAGGGEVRGVVVDAAIVPLENASIRLEPGTRETATGPDGLFSFAGVAPGSYALTAAREGYQAASVTVPVIARVVGPSPLVLRLDSSLIEEHRLGPDVLLDFSVFSGEQNEVEGRGAGLVLNQPYRLITHMFYGFVPPEDWTFGAEGRPPRPP